MIIKKILVKLSLSVATIMIVLQANATNSTDLVLSGNATSDCIVKNEVTFTITVTNNGNSDADSFTVKAPLPAGYTYLSSSSAVGTYSSSSDRWDLTNLAAGTATTLSVTAKGNLSNAALTANLINTTTPDTNSKNNKITIIGNLDSDNDGVFDTCDKDDDNDGITDCQENGLNDSLTGLFVTSGDAKINTMASTQEVILVPDELWKQGQVWATRKIDFTKDFTIAMQAYVGKKDINGADGLAVVLHNDPDTTSTQGTKGLGIGYSGIKNGLALELDTWYNKTTNDIAEDHGTIKQTNDGTVLSNPIALPNLENGKWHDVIVTWDVSAARLHYTVNGLTAGTYINKNIIDDVFGGSSTVYFGYTAATGSRANEHKVRFPNTCETLINFFANDTDGDGLPNHLDLDSDNDGCADALEGSGKFTVKSLSTASTLLANGVGSSAKSRQNLGTIVTTSGANIGIPIDAKSGQAIGNSQKAGQTAITKKPEDKSVNIGNSATFNVEDIAYQTTTYDKVTKKPDYSTKTAATGVAYQWYKSTDNGSTWIAVTSGTTKNLSFNKVAYADVGLYKRTMSCEQNSCKLDTNVVKLSINRPPNANNDTAFVVSGTPVSVPLNGQDVDGYIKNYSITKIPPSNQGTVTYTDANSLQEIVTVATQLTATEAMTVKFTLKSSFKGEIAPITFTVTDNKGATSQPAAVSLRVNVEPQPVPALSLWGSLLMALLMAAQGLRRRGFTMCGFL